MAPEYPATEWLEAVARSIGATPQVVDELIQTWVLLGKTREQMHERLIYLAHLNNRTLVFVEIHDGKKD